MKQAVFIGAGNMGGALIQAACRAIGPTQVVIFDPDAEKAAAFARTLGCTAVASGAEAVAAGEYLFLCVKPQVMATVLQGLIPALEEAVQSGKRRALVSIAAGLETATLRGFLAGACPDLPILRIMPNTCAAIGRGMIALTAPGVEERHFAAVEAILAQAGVVERISEGLMDQFSAVAGCGPAFVYQFIEALADGGVMAGLPRAQAQRYAAQTVLGAAAMVLETGEHPGALKDAVCSPGGSTIAGVAALERGGLRHAAIDAVLCACRRNQELGRSAEACAAVH